MVHRPYIFLPVIGTCIAGPGQNLLELYEQGYDPGFTEDGRKITGGSTIAYLRTRNRELVVETGDYMDQKTLLKNIKRMGLSLESADVMATHAHPDHIGNYNIFRSCGGRLKEIIWISPHAYDIVYGVFSGIENYATKFSWLYEQHKKDDMKIDSFGPVPPSAKLSERVRVIDTEGHANGHISLLVDEPSDIVFPSGKEEHVKGPTVIAGDAVISKKYLSEYLRYREELEENPLADYSRALYAISMFEDRREVDQKALKSYEKILGLVERGGVIIPGHDSPIFF